MRRTAPLLTLLIACAGAPPPEPHPEPVDLPEAPAECLGAPPCEDPRIARIDLAEVGGDGVAEVTYDHAEVTRRVRMAQLGDESDVSVAVRLVLGEVGPERLLANRHALEEAVAILATVRNRLDPAAWNPEDRPAAPWPGCGPGATFAACASPDQYLGLRAWRALDPATRVPTTVLDRAVDRAVAAWWLLSTGAIPDPTGGATSFVHRCGGAAYGDPTTHCDGTGDDDVAGAEPSTGPVVFRGPLAWDEAEGRYRMWRRHVVEFEAQGAL